MLGAGLVGALPEQRNGAQLSPGELSALSHAGGIGFGAAAPMLRVGRTVLTTDPVSAADVFVRRLGGRILSDAQEATVPLGFLSSDNSACATIVTVELNSSFSSQRIQFIYDQSASGGYQTWISNVTHSALLDYKAMIGDADEPLLYSPWEDNHDGYSPTDMINLTALDTDIGGFHFEGPVYRGYVPGSLQQWETPNGPPTVNMASGYTGWPGNCRNGPLNDLYNEVGWLGTGWFKATFSTFAPLEAENLTIAVIGGEHVQSAYPENRHLWDDLGCSHFTRWVLYNLTLPSGAHEHFMIHFVESNSTMDESMDVSGSIDPHDFSRQVLAQRQLGAGVFDSWLYNSIVLQVADLTPHKHALDRLGEPYVERRILGTQPACALWFSIPGSSYAMQLMAPEGCAASSTPVYNACAP